MLIANPIYDSVFKYLLEDLDIAKELLSVILDEQIESLEFKPQETFSELKSESLTVFRLDFKAIIRLKNGETKKVLIELQKAKHLFDIMRFRRYLADNYQKEDFIDGHSIGKALPIITIYFLGFRLADGFPAIFKVKKQIQDIATGEILKNYPKESFVELLNHESYTIQIPLLKDIIQTRIEKVLSVFNQKFIGEDRHELNYSISNTDPLVSKILNRLIRANADEDVRKVMDLEDEMDKTVKRIVREKDEMIEEQAKGLKEKDEVIEEITKENQEKDKKIEEKDALIAELLRKLNEN